MRVWKGPAWWSFSPLIIACLIPDKKCWWNGFRHTFELEQNPCHTSSANTGYCVCSLVWCNGKLKIKFWCSVSSVSFIWRQEGVTETEQLPGLATDTSLGQEQEGKTEITVVIGGFSHKRQFGFERFASLFCLSRVEFPLWPSVSLFNPHGLNSPASL